jgi:hypothetical protein
MAWAQNVIGMPRKDLVASTRFFLKNIPFIFQQNIRFEAKLIKYSLRKKYLLSFLYINSLCMVTRETATPVESSPHVTVYYRLFDNRFVYPFR